MRTRARDARTDAYEKSRTWEKVSKTFRNLNPLCQAIVDGVRCLEPARLVHHLVAPEVCWERRQDWTNLVAVCPKHHGPEAGDVGRYEYADTKLLVGTWFKHIRRYENGPELLPTGTERARQFKSPAPSSEAVDQIMAEALALLAENP